MSSTKEIKEKLEALSLTLKKEVSKPLPKQPKELRHYEQGKTFAYSHVCVELMYLIDDLTQNTKEDDTRY